MGRRYQEELDELSTIRNFVAADTVKKLSELALQASSTGLIVVASGGTKVIAEWACRLHRLVFGSPSVAVTPLEYSSLTAPVRSSVWLLSAGGSHPDIRQAAQAAKFRGDTYVSAIVGQSNTPLEQWLKTELGAISVSLGLPAGVDGFLATNSVWAMACALAEAYVHWMPQVDHMKSPGNNFDELLYWARQETESSLGKIANGSDIVVLHDTWCTLGAQDFEARIIEAALSNLWISDFRNFGHGRHFWMSDRTENTTLIAIWTPSIDEMVEQSLAILPKSLAICPVRIPYDGVTGALASLAWSIHATHYWAIAKNRDPGRPGIPSFGERLYEGGFPYPVAPNIDSATKSIALKIGASGISGAEASNLFNAHKRAILKISDVSISGIVMDFDGTLIESIKRYEPIDTKIVGQLCRILESGVWLGIATGRGDSVQKSLQDAIPVNLRDKVVVGYHNGALVQSLDENVEGLDGLPVGDTFKKASIVLEEELMKHGFATIRSRKFQLTLSPCSGHTLEVVWKKAKECLVRNGLDEIGVWLSSHSVDVVSTQCSKLHVVNRVAAMAECKLENILRIGDRGAWPGNDWQLLNSPLGISVDQCSGDLDSCWNFSPPGMRCTEATEHILNCIQFDGISLKFLLGEN